jgi:hypothetical protein
MKSKIIGYKVCRRLSQEGDMNATFRSVVSNVIRNVEKRGDVLEPSVAIHVPAECRDVLIN